MNELNNASSEEIDIYKNIAEYWFLDHYRALVIEVNENTTVVSIDVYRRKWPFNDYDEEICVSENKYCIVYKRIGNYEKLDNIEVQKIIVTGIKTPEGIETVNVRWFVSGNIGFSNIEKLFYESWKLIGCKGPRNDPWFMNCPEDLDQ